MVVQLQDLRANPFGFICLVSDFARRLGVRGWARLSEASKLLLQSRVDPSRLGVPARARGGPEDWPLELPCCGGLLLPGS